MSFPLLTVTAALPAIGAIATAAVPAARRTAAKWLALAVSLATLVLAGIVFARFEPGGDRYQLTESHAWIKDFGVRYELGVDGIGVALLALTALLIPFVILAGWHDADVLETNSSRWRPTQGFFALILMVEAMVILSFVATDVFLFYILFEAMLIPMYFLIGGFGDRAHSGSDENAAAQRSYAAVKFLLYNLAAWAHHAGRRHRALRRRGELLALGDRRGAGQRLAGHGDLHRAVALPRVLLRLRGEGPALAAAHLAA